MKQYKALTRTGILAFMFIIFYATDTKANIWWDKTIPLQCIHNGTKQNPDKPRSSTIPLTVYYNEEKEELCIESECLPYNIQIKLEEKTIYNNTINNQTYQIILPHIKEDSYNITITTANSVYVGFIK